MHGNLHSNGLFLGFSMDQQRILQLVIMTDLSKLRNFSTAIFSETKSVTPIFFSILGVSTLSTNSKGEMKISPQEDFGANVLNLKYLQVKITVTMVTQKSPNNLVARVTQKWRKDFEILKSGDSRTKRRFGKPKY